MSDPNRLDLDLSRVRALILAGGASSRFFPLDKVFSDPTGCGRTLLEQSFDRISAERTSGTLRCFLAPEQCFVATSPSARGRVLETLAISKENVIAEPCRRNTWPAILWALARLRREGDDLVVVVLTADHWIGDVESFRNSLAEAIDVARSRDAIVTFGIPPSTEPGDWTAFGAIRAEGASTAIAGTARRVARFEEKPTLERAREMIAEGGWAWNSGMFVFRIESALKALSQIDSELSRRFLEIARSIELGDEQRAEEIFSLLAAKIPHPTRSGAPVDHSIDFAILMPITMSSIGVEALVLPGRFPWSDVGSWDALRELVPADENGNIRIGKVEAREVRDSILLAEPGREIEARDVAGLVIVHAADGTLLVTHERDAPELRTLVRQLPETMSCGIFCSESEDVFVESKVASDRARTIFFRVGALEVQREGARVSVAPLAHANASARATILDRLGDAPRVLVPAVRNYAWGGSVLPDVLGVPRPAEGTPTAEAWLTSTRPEAPTTLAESPIDLSSWIAARPEVLGDWSRRLFGDEAPIFIKLLSTRFPPRVHIAFRPGAVGGDRDRFRSALLASLVRERDELRELHRSLGKSVHTDPESFATWRELWERWATNQMLGRWLDVAADGELTDAVRPLLAPHTNVVRFFDLLFRLRDNRSEIVALLHDVDLREEVGNALLSEAGLPHAIFGLSHQSHPVDRSGTRLRALLGELRSSARSGADEAFLVRLIDETRPEIEKLRSENPEPPKNEAWIPIEIDGEILIVEPQQTSNTTYGWLDMITPFELRDGRLVFRKGDPGTGLDDVSLARYVEALDIEPRELESLRRRPAEIDTGPEARNVRLFRLVDDPSDWPYFTIYRVDLLGGSGRHACWAGDHPRGAFQEIVVSRGAARLTDRRGRVVALDPGRPVFVPATAHGGYLLESEGEATLWLVSVPTPYEESPARHQRP